ncbi:MAG: hypothetical protein IJI56_04400 [Firmicutes bacterium]|nr:hypothetical protein [Bacillota bacterium]
MFKNNVKDAVKNVSKGLAVAAAGIIIVESSAAMSDPESFIRDFNQGIGSEPSSSSMRELSASADHIWEDEGVVIKDPTCAEKGVLRFFCKICDATKDEDIPLLEHTESEHEALEPSCTEDGHTRSVVCSVCGKVLVEEQVIAALGHSWGPDSVVRAASCTISGLREARCTRCSEVRQTTIAALGHNWGPETTVKEATCTEDGLREIRCSRCNEAQETVVAALGHDWGEETVIREASCTEEGAKAIVCSRCGLSQETVIAALGHDWGEETVIREASCTEEGAKAIVCSRCGLSQETSIPMIDHHDGNGDYKCDACGLMLLDISLVSVDHTSDSHVARFSLNMDVYHMWFSTSLTSDSDYIGMESVQDNGEILLYIYITENPYESEWTFNITIFSGYSVDGEEAVELLTKPFKVDINGEVTPVS